LRHAIPNGDVGAIVDRALTALLADLSRTKHAATPHPRGASVTQPSSRHIPAAVRRAVWERDGGRCAFIGTTGRCAATGLLEFHHVVPFAVGGKADIAGIELRCAPHNKYEAEQYFGRCHSRRSSERGFLWEVESPV
jgi:5-methylcytosine-specific restriction endonuclease McrA